MELLNIYAELRNMDYPAVMIPESFGCSPSDLEIFGKHYQTPLPGSLIEFLSTTLPIDFVDIGVYKTKNAAGLLDEQLNVLPYTQNIKNDLFTIGWWTGETDGDSWCFDLKTELIHSIRIDDYEEGKSRSAVLDDADFSFDSFSEWSNFLTMELINRNWLPR